MVILRSVVSVFVFLFFFWRDICVLMTYCDTSSLHTLQVKMASFCWTLVTVTQLELLHWMHLMTERWLRKSANNSVVAVAVDFNLKTVAARNGEVEVGLCLRLLLTGEETLGCMLGRAKTSARDWPVLGVVVASFSIFLLSFVFLYFFLCLFWFSVH